MKKDYIKRDCKYYDWGDTAPREYGAFCRPHGKKRVRIMTYTLCRNCPDYKKSQRS